MSLNYFNRSVFGEDMDKNLVECFWTHRVVGLVAVAAAASRSL